MLNRTETDTREAIRRAIRRGLKQLNVEADLLRENKSLVRLGIESGLSELRERCRKSFLETKGSAAILAVAITVALVLGGWFVILPAAAVVFVLNDVRCWMLARREVRSVQQYIASL